MRVRLRGLHVCVHTARALNELCAYRLCLPCMCLPYEHAYAPCLCRVPCGARTELLAARAVRVINRTVP